MSKGKDETPQPTKSKYSKQLESKLFEKTGTMLDVPYSDWLKRFTVPESPFRGMAREKYQNLFEEEDYGMADYEKTEKDYLDVLLGEYREEREEGFKPIRESLIGQNLWGSGPGYEQWEEYAGETAKGVGDITKKWAYEGMERQFRQRQYTDALKRGDYMTMYNLALQEEAKALDPRVRATQMEMAGIEPAMGLFGQLTQRDIAEYQARLQAKSMEQKKNLAGLGTALGIGAGVLLAAPTGGMSMLAGGSLGGAAGGGLGSMFEY